jgi:arylsulfatase
MSLKKPKKIILITIDTLRADHLGCYGYDKPTSPNLDKLAGEGVMYPYVFSPCSYTVPVHTSILTGIYPINHDIGFSQKTGKIDPDNTILVQEILREQGYATGAFVSSFVLRRDWGLSQGFDIYDDSMTSSETNRPGELMRDGAETTRVALEWINKNKSEDFFVWLHYFDVHGPYTQLPGLADPFKPEDYGDSPILLNKVRDGQPCGIPEYQLLEVKKKEGGEILDYQRDIRHYMAGYDNGIKYQDKVISELLENLKSEGIYEESMIIVTADHGEALGEGGIYFFHGLTVTPEQSRVPLIIKFPAGCEQTAVPDSPVSTVDIMPTILDYTGFSSEMLGLVSPDPDRFILSENEWQRSVIWRNYFMTDEKRVVNDGSNYYFDSQELCRGRKLIDYKNGIEINFDSEGPAGELIKYSGFLSKAVDSLERRLKRQDMELAENERAIVEKDNEISEKEEVVAVLSREISVRGDALTKMDNALSECRSKTEHLESELESIYNSKSWRLTSPIRWVSARLKGLND